MCNDECGGIVILRVISGEARGHKLKTVKGNTTRPTADRVKESLFNIIAAYVEDAAVLDLFAGTGNLGIEALSRGAGSAVFVDKSRECYQVIKDNLLHTQMTDRATVITGEAAGAIGRLANESRKFDIVFLDPPYGKNLIAETLNFLSNSGIINDNGIVVGERDAQDEIPEEVGRLKLVRNQKYGDTVLSFFKQEA